MRCSALRRGDSTPLSARKPEVFLMISKTVSMAWRSSVVVGFRAPRGGGRLASEGGQFFLELGALKGGDQIAKRTLQDLREVVAGEADAVIRHTALREIIGADALAAV